MKISCFQIIIIGITYAIFINGQTTKVDILTNECLDCICDAISGCNVSLGCEGDVCGLFKITKPYWIDADKLVVKKDQQNLDEAYKKCTTDINCAGQTVRNYMFKYPQDCNGDRKINCYDYAAIHKFGRVGCDAPLQGAYKDKIERCIASLSESKSN